MRTKITLLIALISLFLNLEVIQAQTPEILYYNFNGVGTTVPNQALTPPVGAENATVMGGVTLGGVGQCGTNALVGSGVSSSTDYLNTNWAPNLGTSSWTISFWSSGISSNTTLYYIFGDANTASFRCFTNGVAGANNWILRGAGLTDIVLSGGALSTPTMNTFVYDNVANNVKAYLNGVLVNTVAQGAPNITGAGPLKVMGYGSNIGAPAGGMLDEFSIYNRALSDAEVLSLSTSSTPAPTVTTPVTYAQGATATPLTATGTSLLWYTSSTGGTGDTTAPTPSTTVTGTTSYWVSQTSTCGEGPRAQIDVIVIGPASALNFDGVDDYVDCGNSALLNITGSLSVEAFIYRNTLNTDDCIIGKDIYATSTGYSFWVYQNNKLVFRFGNREYFSTSTIGQNTWTHVAATYEAGDIKLYINGVLDATYTSIAPPDSNTDGLYLGTPQDAVGNSLFAFSGKMDEVRIWNRSLEQCEIQNNMNGELPSGQTGLLAYYQFNQGFDSQDNTAITSLTDFSGNNNNGTLNNFVLNGPTSNWVNPGGVTTGSTSPAYSPMTVATSQTLFPPSTVANLTATGTNINWYNVPVGGTALASTTTLTTGIYYVTQTTGTCETSRIAVQVNIIASALNFDGSNDGVYLGNTINTVLDPLNTITVEAWVNPTNTIFNGVIVGNYYNWDNNMQFLLRRDFDTYTFWVNDGTGFKAVDSGLNTVVINTWQHVAGVWDGSSLYIYVDGVLKGTTTGVTGSNFAYTNNSVVIGTNSYPEPFNGSIDELRIWTRALNQCEIQNNMNGELAGGQTGLLAYYQFNQGIASADNTAITSIIDSSGNNYGGGLSGFALTGTTSNWVSPGAVSTNTSSPLYVAPNVNAVTSASVCNNSVIAPVIFSSSTTGTLCGQTNETGTITLTAPVGAVFTSIPFASYGTPNGTCGNFTFGPCHASNSNSIVSALALGQNNFSIGANNGTFGDPCGFVGKRLYIEAVYNNTIFNWTNDTPSIGLSANGTGDLPSFTATNSGSTPIVATITVTPMINGCAGTPIQFTITVNPTSTVTGSSTQVINGGVAADATIEDIVVNPTTVIWYASSSDALAGINALPAGTQLIDGAEYFAVNYENGCVSTPLAVTVTVVLGNDTFDMSSFNLYPNPTSGVVTLQYSKEITEISVLNLLGQTMLNKKLSTTETTIDLSNFPSATYFVKVVSEGKIKIVKVIKR